MSVFRSYTRSMDTAARMEAANARAKATDARQKVDDVVSRLDRALLACEAMWTLLRDRLGVTDDELIERINAIDLSDGQLDGKVRRTSVACPSCGRTLARRFPKCMYCGTAIQQDPFA